MIIWERWNGNLYLVATPIGNLEDITLRAINILKKVDIIAAEDTRHTLKLLNHLNIKKPLISYYKQTEKTKSIEIIDKIKNGKNIALVSDAGTPGISDPGEEIVRCAIKEQVNIIPIPGACAMINAIIASGMKTNEFLFVGFLATNKGEKREKLNNLKLQEQTIIFYEAPHKILNTLKEILAVFGDRRIVLAREITKVHEEFIRGNISEVLLNLKDPKGEFVIIVEGSNKTQKEILVERLSEMSLEEHFAYYQKQGLDKKEIIKRIARDRKVNKNEIYQHFIK